MTIPTPEMVAAAAVAMFELMMENGGAPHEEPNENMKHNLLVLAVTALAAAEPLRPKPES